MLKKKENKGKEYLLKVKRRVAWILAVVYVVFAGSPTVYASGFQGSIYETGTKKMMKDLLSVIQGVAVGIVLALWALWEVMKRTSADNEEDKYTKKQKGALIGLIILETIATFVGIIGGYYGIKVN